MNRTSTRTQRLGPLTVAALTAALFLVGPGARVAGAQTDAFIVNNTSARVTVISTAVPPSHPPQSVPVGAGPTQLVISGDGQWAYVANTGAPTVPRINTNPPYEVPTFDVGGSPTSLAVSQNGDDLYVLLDPADVVAAFQHSTTTPSPRGTPIPVGTSLGGLALTPGDGQLWAAAGEGTVIDTNNPSPAGVITHFAPEVGPHDPEVYNFAVGIAIDQATSTVYVTYNTYDYGPIRFSASGGIAVITPAAVVDHVVPLFSLPGPIALSADGKFAFASIQWVWFDSLYGAGFMPTEWVASVETGTNIISWIDLGGGGANGVYTGAGLAVTPDRSAVFVAVPTMKGVAVIDATTSTLKPDAAVLLDGQPKSVAFVPDVGVPASTLKIVAVDDAPAASFPPGGSKPAIANVLDNDTLGGHAAVAGVNVQLIPPGSFPAGLSLDTAGAVWVLAGAAPGTQTFAYQICEKAHPQNCGNANVTVNVRAPYAITAGDDSGSSAPGGFAITNVLANDSFNGATASLADVTLTVTGGDSAAISIDAWGSAAVAANASAGPHSITYRICETASPSNCSNNATVMVSVLNRPIVANDDAVIVSRAGGVSLLNVMANDRFDGGPALGRVAFFGPAAAGGVAVDAAGNVSVAQGAAVGALALKYQICEVGRLDNCATGNLVVTVTPNVIVAVGDSARLSPKQPATGIANVLANDRLGGGGGTTANVELSLVSVSPPTNGLVLNTSTGAINVVKGANSGTFSMLYQICEIGTPTNCARATATIDLSSGGGRGR